MRSVTQTGLLYKDDSPPCAHVSFHLLCRLLLIFSATLVWALGGCCADTTAKSRAAAAHRITALIFLQALSALQDLCFMRHNDNTDRQGGGPSA